MLPGLELLPLDLPARSQSLYRLRYRGSSIKRRDFLYSASHSRVAPENVGLQKEQNNTFACHICNEVRLCVLGIRKKEVGNTKR
jgi:hypothetical protein